MTVPKVTVSLLGNFALRLDGIRQPLHVAGNTKRLLMLLASQANKGFRREYVIEEIWPTSTVERGASSMNSAVCRLRSGLENFPGLSLEAVDDVIRLRVRPPASTDAAELTDALAEISGEDSPTQLTASQRLRLTTAVGASGREFLEGCGDHWVLPLRERYCALIVKALTLLMNDAGLIGDYEQALDYGRQILERDPFRESVQRAVMSLYALNCQRAQAILQFRRLEDQLSTELGITPMAETVTLYESILRPEFASSSAQSVLSVGRETGFPAG